MASADWMKLTSPHAAGMKKHLGTEERLSVNHSNVDIDKSKSHLNLSIGCKDYSEALAAMRARVKEVDRLYPPLRKKPADERVIAEMIEVKCPQEIMDKGYAAACEYFRGVYGALISFFGDENVHGGFAHFDEIHKYRDKDGVTKDSLAHMHVLVSCYCEWTEKGKKPEKSVSARVSMERISRKKPDTTSSINPLMNSAWSIMVSHIPRAREKSRDMGNLLRN